MITMADVNPLSMLYGRSQTASSSVFGLQRHSFMHMLAFAPLLTYVYCVKVSVSKNHCHSVCIQVEKKKQRQVDKKKMYKKATHDRAVATGDLLKRHHLIDGSLRYSSYCSR